MKPTDTYVVRGCVLSWPTAPGGGRTLLGSSRIRLAFITNQEQSRMSSSAVTEQDMYAADWLIRQTNSFLLNDAEAKIYCVGLGKGGHYQQNYSYVSYRKLHIYFNTFRAGFSS